MGIARTLLAFSILVLFGFALPGADAVKAQALQVLKQAEKRSEAAAQPTTPGQQSLETLLEPTVRKLVEEKLAEGSATRQGAAPDQGGGDPFAALIDGARNSMNGITKGIDGVIAIWPLGQSEIEDAFILLTDFEGWPRMWTGIANLLLMLAGGGFLAWMTRRMFGQLVVAPAAIRGRLLPSLTVTVVVLLRDLLVLVVMVAAGFLLSLVWFSQFDPMRIFLISYLAVTVVVVAGWFLGNALFAPNAPERRMVDLDDRSARRMVYWLAIVLGLAALAGFSMGMLRLLGMPQAMLDIVQLGVGGLLALVTLFAVIRTPTDPQRIPASTGLSALLHQLFGRYRRVWLVVATAMFLLLWSLSVFSPDPSKTVAVFGLFGALAGGLFVARLHNPAEPEDETPAVPADDAGEAGMLEMKQSGGLLPSVRQIAYVVLALVGLAAFLHVVALDIVALQQSPVGQLATEVLLDVLVILLVASIGWALVQRTITRFIDRENERAMAAAADHAVDEDGLGGLIVSRFGTLLPLIRGFILTILVAITVMVVLSSLGLDIGPLIAGAGVVGIAIGFGAQALVRDIISGIFFLIDDAFRVGEYVEFGEIRGQVEQISIRSMRLRHHRGAIHTVPFGELRSITNYNRDWAIYKQEFRLPYDTDVDKVRKIIKKVGLRLLEDPELGPKFIQPLKSQGVFRIEEGALILRTKFTCKPREQFMIRKAVFQEVKNDLYAAGIELAQRRVQIEWPDWAKGDGETETMNADTPTAVQKPGGPQTPPAGAVAAAGAAGLVIAQNTQTKEYPDEP
ncbi:MAG: mechanosensitive ion channel family protein [Minwuia sp.]|nr:mechanosensitive ion channel family protein [Minwuia sp.]